MSASPHGRMRSLARLTLAALALAYAQGSQAFFNPFDMFGGDDYDDDYYGGPGPYGYGGPPGYYGGPPGYGGGYGPYGYGAPYGGPGYYGGYGGPSPYGAQGPYGVPAAAPSASPPASSGPSSADQAREIESLKRRIEELESQRGPASASPPGSTSWPSSPAFRPQDRY